MYTYMYVHALAAYHAVTVVTEIIAAYEEGDHFPVIIPVNPRIVVHLIYKVICLFRHISVTIHVYQTS